MSSETVLTKLARIAGRAATVMRLRSRKLQVLGPKGPLLTNRVSESFTHGSVGGVGRKPGSYPAANRREPATFLSSQITLRLPPMADVRRYLAPRMNGQFTISSQNPDNLRSQPPDT